MSRQHGYVYDNAGNLLKETEDSKVLHEFNYDPAGRVYFRRSEPFAANGYDYYYNNSDGTMVRRTRVGPAGDDTVYIGGLYERRTVNNDTTVIKYYYAGGRRIAMRQDPPAGADTVYVLATDHLGSTGVVMSDLGTLVNRVKYYPFGNIRSKEGSLVTDKLFTGQQLDSTGEQQSSPAGIYHFPARLYDATIGRFIQPDPIVPTPGNPQALNRYSYVLNNPLRYTDPSGLCAPGIGNCPDPEAGYPDPLARAAAIVGQPDPEVGIGGDFDSYCYWAHGRCRDAHNRWFLNTLWAAEFFLATGWNLDSIPWNPDQRLDIAIDGFGSVRTWVPDWEWALQAEDFVGGLLAAGAIFFIGGIAENQTAGLNFQRACIPPCEANTKHLPAPRGSGVKYIVPDGLAVHSQGNIIGLTDAKYVSPGRTVRTVYLTRQLRNYIATEYTLVLRVPNYARISPSFAPYVVSGAVIIDPR